MWQEEEEWKLVKEQPATGGGGGDGQAGRGRIVDGREIEVFENVLDLLIFAGKGRNAEEGNCLYYFYHFLSYLC